MGLAAAITAGCGSERDASDRRPDRQQLGRVRIGEADATMFAMRALLERGVYVAGIRPPTVPPGTSRLRLSVMATHSEDQLETAAKAVIESVEAAT